MVDADPGHLMVQDHRGICDHDEACTVGAARVQDQTTLDGVGKFNVQCVVQAEGV